MSSQVGGDLSRIESGPCSVKFKGEFCGHTVDGVSMNVKPKLRNRMVDEYGENIVEIIHTGDDVSVQTKFPEKTLEVIQTVYMFGYSIDGQTWGIGAKVGAKGSDKAGALLLHPLDAEDTADDVQFWKCVVTDTGEVQFGLITADRVFQCTFVPLVDESHGNYVLGQIGVHAD